MTNKTDIEENTKSLKSVKNVDGSIFQYFKDLTSEEEQVRINAGLQLLQHIAKPKESEKHKKELLYCLKRLIRGVGASTCISRSGFYTTLVAFFQTAPMNSLTMQTILDTVQKELNVGTAISNKEDADAVVGKVLVCSSLLRSGKLAQADKNHLEEILKILIHATRCKTYHISLAYTVLIDMIEQLTITQFNESIWPLLQVELTKPWLKQTIQTFHCLITIQRKYPTILNKQFMKTHFGGKQLLNSESQEHIHSLFWSCTNSDILTHPALEAFGLHLATCTELKDFWTNHVDPSLKNPTKLQQIISLKICTDVLAHLNPENAQISELLTPNFVQTLIVCLKNAKTKKDETLNAFCDEFFQNLTSCCSKTTADDDRVKVIQKLILYPGSFNIEKFTTNRVVHQLIGFLGEKGVQDIFKTYKDIFLDRLVKNPENKSETWLNFERQIAAYMLQHLLSHKSVQNSFLWRQEQLQFFMSIALFNVNNRGEICIVSEAGQLQKDFGIHMKNIFYASLQSKVPALNEEKSILTSLVETCNSYMQKKNAAKYFRVKIDEKVTKAWGKMYSEIKKSKKVNENERKQQLVFHMLLLHMGLQLFYETDMAETAIYDLEKCMAKAKGKSGDQKKSDSEPEWIEVIVDLFLHLLSQNVGILRSVVNMVFPHLCENLSLTAMHQILSMLDMKDGQSPFGNELENDEENEENKNDSADEEENSSDESLSDDDEDDDDDDEVEEEADEDEDDEDNEATVSDKLRNAVSTALNSVVPQDDDQVSIDLNDMTEEDGRKLDEALSAAFKALKKSGKGDSQNKKSKSYRVHTTTAMHFRIRVLDLIEIYIQHKPSLVISIEILFALFNMLEFCTDEEHKPLQTKVEKVLNKLTSLKQFVSTEDVTEENLVSFIRMIIDTKPRSVVFDVQNRLKNKCCMFLIASAKQLKETVSNNQIITLLIEYLEDFLKSRNPAVNITLLSDIFKLRWQGVWSLASVLFEKGISATTRTFRRIQVFELLVLIYKNHELIKQNEKVATKHLKRIEKIFAQYIEEASNTPTVSVKEFNTILESLTFAQRCYTKFSLELTQLHTCAGLIQKTRTKVKLDSMQSYHRFCNAYKLKPLKNAVQEQNGLKPIADPDEEVSTDSEEQKSLKRKSQSTNTEISSKKSKKLKKEERMKALSKGLNGGFNFNTSGTMDIDMDD